MSDLASWARIAQVRTAVDDEDARTQRFQRGWDAYHGRFDKPLVVDTPKTGQPGAAFDDNTLLPWSREIIDTGVEWLFGKGEVGFEVGEDDNEQTPQEAYLASVWKANRKDITLLKLATNGGVCGHAFLKIRPRNAGPLVPTHEGEPLPRLIVLDPANCTVTWDDEDVEDVWRYTIRWITVDRKTAKPRVRRQRIERTDAGDAWDIVDEESGLEQSEAAWVQISEERWPFPWAPIVDCQNLPLANDYWGLSDIEASVLELNRVANVRASDLSRIHRLQAHGKMWTKGLTDEQAKAIDTALDKLVNLPDPLAELNYLELTGEAATSLEWLRFLKQEFRDATDMPEINAEALKGLGSLSGLALGILWAPTIFKTSKKRGTYGGMLLELNRRLLDHGGFPLDDEDDVTLRWPELVPSDPKEEAEIALAKQQAGVSTDTTIAELGYDPDKEREKKASEPKPVDPLALLDPADPERARLRTGRPIPGDGQEDDE